MNIQQTRNAQNVIRQAIIITNHGVMKIENVVRLVNTAWTDANQPYPLPYGEYKRRAWLLADLTRIQQQLADQLRDLEFGAGLPVDEETGTDTRECSGNSIAADHAEALEMDKQATHFRREQSDLTERVRKIMGKTPTTTENVIPMNKAKAKQNQTPDNLPRLQLVDVVRAFLRTVPTSSQEQIEAVGDLSHKELRNLIIKMTTKGARVTAHLTKSKSAGYGFLTFGYNGQLPPGTYHKIVVSNMKNARDVASQYGAVMWNF